jgi:hypothetical protein
MIEPIYTIPACARRLNIGISAMYALVRTGQVKSGRSGAGKIIRITESSVMEFLRGGGDGEPGKSERKAA